MHKMTTTILKILILIAVVSFMGFGIHDDNECLTKAEIVGFDYRKCGGCWGWKVKINDTIFIASKLPGLMTPPMHSNYDSLKIPKEIIIGYKKTDLNRAISVECMKILKY